MAKGHTYVVDADDLCENVLTQEWKGQTIVLLDWLQAWKERVPALKLTLFTIPQRTSDETIVRFKDLPWVALAPHGHVHTRGECLGWSKEEAVEKIEMARERGIDAPIFRAPGWLLDGDVYEACRQLGYVVASHEHFRIPHSGVPEYVYNAHWGHTKVRPVHGHLTPVSGNWIYDMMADNRLSFPSKAQFAWCHEEAVVIP